MLCYVNASQRDNQSLYIFMILYILSSFTLLIICMVRVVHLDESLRSEFVLLHILFVGDMNAIGAVRKELVAVISANLLILSQR
jgi:hypothetical protein